MSELLGLGAIEVTICDLGARLGVGAESLPTMGESEQSGRPHIEVDGRGYHYVSCERGHEFARHTTLDLDELLYWVFRSVTLWMATNWELKRRAPGQDTRRLWFPKQEELIGGLSAAWSDRLRLEHAETLGKYPFHDE